MFFAKHKNYAECSKLYPAFPSTTIYIVPELEYLRVVQVQMFNYLHKISMHNELQKNVRKFHSAFTRKSHDRNMIEIFHLLKIKSINLWRKGRTCKRTQIDRWVSIKGLKQILNKNKNFYLNSSRWRLFVFPCYCIDSTTPMCVLSETN